MRVAVTGGTGFVGPAVVDEIVKEGHEVVLLVHKQAPPAKPGVMAVEGDVTDPDSLRKAFAGCDAVVHLVAIIREVPKRGITFERIHVDGTRNVVEAAKAVGVKRFVLMSANGVDLGLDTPYFRTKLDMERMVKEAGFEWTIFRPSYVSASDDGGFDAQFADVIQKAPVLPSFGGGKFEIQPVARRDVAKAFARSLKTPASVGKTYTLVGPDRMTWNEYVTKLAKLRRLKRPLAPAPRWAVMSMATVLGPLFPASPDQLRMMMAGNVGDPSEAVKDLNLTLTPWEEAVALMRR